MEDVDLDRIRYHVSSKLARNPNDLQLAYRTPKMKKGDPRRHLRTVEHFDAMMDEVREAIDALVGDVQAAQAAERESKKGKGKGTKRTSTAGKQALVKLRDYVVTLYDLPTTKGSSSHGDKNVSHSHS